MPPGGRIRALPSSSSSRRGGGAGPGRSLLRRHIALPPALLTCLLPPRRRRRPPTWPQPRRRTPGCSSPSCCSYPRRPPPSAPPPGPTWAAASPSASAAPTPSAAVSGGGGDEGWWGWMAGDPRPAAPGGVRECSLPGARSSARPGGSSPPPGKLLRGEMQTSPASGGAFPKAPAPASAGKSGRIGKMETRRRRASFLSCRPSFQIPTAPWAGCLVCCVLFCSPPPPAKPSCNKPALWVLFMG